MSNTWLFHHSHIVKKKVQILSSAGVLLPFPSVGAHSAPCKDYYTVLVISCGSFNKHTLFWIGTCNSILTYILKKKI